jgi:hypothetical protein
MVGGFSCSEPSDGVRNKNTSHRPGTDLPTHLGLWKVLLGEGACKHVVGKQLKQSGIIWNRTGSSAILALRIVWLNAKWEQLWQNKPLTA